MGVVRRKTCEIWVVNDSEGGQCSDGGPLMRFSLTPSPSPFLIKILRFLGSLKRNCLMYYELCIIRGNFPELRKNSVYLNLYILWLILL